MNDAIDNPSASPPGAAIPFGVLLPLFLLNIVIVVFWGGEVTKVLWNWFMTPLSVHPITLWHSVGLSAMVSLFTASPGRSAAPRVGGSQLREVVWSTAWCAATPTVLLLIGYIAKTHMA